MLWERSLVAFLLGYGNVTYFSIFFRKEKTSSEYDYFFISNVSCTCYTNSSCLIPSRAIVLFIFLQ